MLSSTLLVEIHSCHIRTPSPLLGLYPCFQALTPTPPRKETIRTATTFSSSIMSDSNLFPLLIAAVNNALNDEVEPLRVTGGMGNPNGGHMTNNGADFDSNQQVYPYTNELHTLITTHQLQQLQIRPPLHPNQVQHQPLMRNKGPDFNGPWIK